METKDSQFLLPTQACRIYGTVVSGFESVAREECEEHFGSDVSDITTERGAIFFSVPLSRINDIFTLRSVDNLYSVLLENNIAFSDTKETALQQVKSIAIRDDVDWKTGFAVWKAAMQQLEVDRFQRNQIDIPKSVLPPTEFVPSYRATCYRSGKHCFTSQEAMPAFGGALNTAFEWKVNLTDYDVEAVLIVDGERVRVCLTLTREPLFKRNITHFGRSTLKSTISYSMLRLAEIKSGDIVCDPMCGSGSIPLEAAASYPGTYFLAGDNFALACESTLRNCKEMPSKTGKTMSTVDVLHCDLAAFPFRPHSVDAWISDFPFGKRHKCDRRTLYPKALDAMANASKEGITRAVILTMDRRAFSEAVKTRKQWYIRRMININIGGLSACVYCLLRTSLHV